MLFFNSYTSSNYKKRDLIDGYYDKIIKISRNKVFYTKLMVPDTIDGRFDLLILFSIIQLIRSLYISFFVSTYSFKFLFIN